MSLKLDTPHTNSQLGKPSLSNEYNGVSSSAPITTQHNGPVLNFDPPKFAVEHNVSSDSTYEYFMNAIGNIIGVAGQIPCCICFPNPFKQIQQGKIGLINRFGKYYKTVDPGLVYVNPITEQMIRVDVKIQLSTVHQIPIVTKDNVNISIDSVLYWHIVDPYQSTFGVSNVEQALVERAQTTLRSVLGGKSLQDLIENRDTISDAIKDYMDAPSRQWGVKIESILIKDIIFSESLQLSLSSAATQKRIGESKVIAAQAEVDSAKLMREAAEILNIPAAMQIRYLETLQAMSKSAGTKVMFVPMSETSGMHGFSSNNPYAQPQTIEANDENNNVPFPTPNHVQSGSGGGMAMNSSVRDSALFEQLSNM
ncbi:putative band 7 family protein [Smittium mucronatum]|uniref:Putative band 7 family protein n=1 Tax=Smittium mucronatum TaxID=133383 RepID=A0A1R0GSL2_9FUNG|nr:putative band 7 family protein [Smittium mucronatum]